MPLASSNDLIIAGIHDILQALAHPSAGSPLAPLTDSHHDALQQLTSILTIVATPPASDADSGPPSIAHLDDVRIHVAPPDTSLRVPTIESPPALTPTADTPLRVLVPLIKSVTFAPLPTPSLTTFA